MWLKRDGLNTIREVCLRNLGVESTDDVNNWFIRSRNGGYKIPLLSEAKDFLEKYREKPVVICGDYDADGVMGTSIAFMALSEAGFKNVSYKIPKRHSEGYGLNLRMVGEILEEHGPDACLLAVDNGIAAFEALSAAKKHGMGVVVLDHHLAAKDENGERAYPEADIIIDPAAVPGSADFCHYCGAGLAYKLAAEFLGGNAKIFMPLAAVATFADVMPLREENYVFARDGLNLLNKGIAPAGLLALKSANNLEKVSDQDVLFKIAPQVNAPGRLIDDGALKSVALAISDIYSAPGLAEELIAINAERKSLVDIASNILMSKIGEKDKDIYVEYVPGVNQGIVGILAGKICENKRRPAIVFTDNGKDEDIVTGSARSVDGVNIKGVLDKCASLIEA